MLLHDKSNNLSNIIPKYACLIILFHEFYGLQALLFDNTHFNKNNNMSCYSGNDGCGLYVALPHPEDLDVYYFSCYKATCFIFLHEYLQIHNGAAKIHIL